MANFLAVDLGAASGRVMLGVWDGARFALRELHRFPNGAVAVGGHLYWDVLRLWQEINVGLARYGASYDEPLAGIGIDTWAVDFALLDRAGMLLGNPYHYRDRRSEGSAERVDALILPTALYAQTGSARLPFNTIYQLAAMRAAGDPQLDAAAHMLLIPDLLGYWLTGRMVAEYTNATTTGFYDARLGGWAVDLLTQLDLPSAILPPLVGPGTIVAPIRPEVSERAGLAPATPLIAVGTHDTASAVAAVPGLDRHSVYISSGTWSLVGVELPAPLLSERARLLNFTNEGGVGNTIRLLRNVGGLWLLQECQRSWERQGQQHDWAALVALAAAAAPLHCIVDPDAPEFLNPADMPTAIREYCRRSGQPAPDDSGALVRCCLESLALRYRWVVAALEELVGHPLTTIRIVGGGSQNQLLAQLTADACQRRVVCGPVEATALGNIMVQAIAGGYLPDLAAGRQVVAASAELSTFDPRPPAAWDSAFARFTRLIESVGQAA